MSLGTWDPTAANGVANIEIEPQQLEKFIQFSRAGQLEELAELLSSGEHLHLEQLMQLEAGPWQEAVEQRSNDELLHLVRFFTLAENLPGCEAADKSPVIPLAKILRQRGQKLDKDFLLWMRQVNKNRYLPYGPLV